MKHLAAITLCAALAQAACYGSTHNQRAEAERAWDRGERDAAVSMGRAMYDRFARDNRDASEAVPEAMALIRERLEDELVIPQDIRLRAPPDVAMDDDGAGPKRSVHRDLVDATLSLDAGRALPAIRNIAALGLTRLAKVLFVVLDRPEPFEDTSTLTRGLSVAIRSLAVKQMALHALETLAGPQPQ